VSLKIDKGKTCELIAQKVFDKLSIYTPAGWNEENVLLKLIDDLGYHALAVDVAGALLERTKGLQSFADFRKKLSHTEKDELEYASKLKEILPTGHEKSIASTLLRSIKQLEPKGLISFVWHPFWLWLQSLLLWYQLYFQR